MPDRVYKELNDVATEDGISMKDLMQSIIGNFLKERSSKKGKKATRE